MAPTSQLPFEGESFFTYKGTSAPEPGQPAERPAEEPPASAGTDDDVDDSAWGDASLPARQRDRVPGPARSFQASAGIQGRQFAEQCDTLLTHLGYQLQGRRVLTEVGVEIDQEAVSPTGRLVWFEYKGSVQGSRPGLRRTDTLKKAIANGALLRSLADPAPYVVITSHLPESGSGAAMLKAAMRLRCFADVICLYDPTDTTRLQKW
jgi:hypothetical protein